MGTVVGGSSAKVKLLHGKSFLMLNIDKKRFIQLVFQQRKIAI